MPGPQGPQGPVGPSGASGADGHNAYTLTSAGFTVPNVGANVSVSVVYGLWASVGQNIFIQSAGVYTVISASASSITVQNTGAVGNAAPTTIIGNVRQVSPSGYIGALTAPVPIIDGGTGESNKTDAFDALSPLSVTGDILAFSAGSNVRIAPGTSGFVWTSNGAGVLPTYQLNAPSAANITGTLPILHGGTGGTTIIAARANLVVPGLVVDNAFAASNSYDVSTGLGKQFKVFSGANTYLLIDELNGLYLLGDTLGNYTVDFGSSILLGAWTQTKKSATEATGATHVITDEETIVSRRSLAGTQTITLPAGAANRVVRIVDGDGNASVNNITINRAGGDTVMGATSALISLDYGTLAIRFISATNNWVPCP